jgi:hypothetical protein
MREDNCSPESQKADQQVAQHRHHLVVFADQQQTNESQSQRHHQPARDDAGE